MSFVGDLFGGGNDAGDAAIKASEISAGAQEKALEYLKEREAIPQHYREEALNKLGGIYGLPGLSAFGVQGSSGKTVDPNSLANIIARQSLLDNFGIGTNARLGTGTSTGAEPSTGVGSGINYTQQQFLNEIIQSPLYQSIMSGQKSGEEAIMRNASQTGGLRSGNTNYALYDYNTQLQNQALLETYNQNISALQGLAGLPSNANNIANTMSNIGTTRGQGIIAAAQANQVGSQNQMNNMLGMGSLGLDMYNSGLFSKIGSMFSDRRLKFNINKIGEVNGFNWYSFTWNKIANALGLEGSTQGCMADEVFQKRPDAVTLKDGFMFIDYSLLGE